MKLSLSQFNFDQAPNKREKYIFFVAMAVFFMVFMKSCWYPSTTAISDIKKDISTLESDRSILTKKNVPQAKRPSAIDPNKQGLYNEFGKKVWKDPDAVIIKELTGPTVLRGLKIDSINMVESKIEGDILKERFQMQVSGTFASIGSYLARIEGLPIIMIIDKLKMNRSPGTDDRPEGSIDAELGGVVYGWK